MTDTYERLTAILIKDYKLSADKLTPDATLEALGIDSLGTVELLWSVEDVFRIKLPGEPVPLATLGEVVAYVDRLIAEQAATPVPGTASAPAPNVASAPAPNVASTPTPGIVTSPDSPSPSA